MPSQNTNIIANLRGKHDPHYKLATRVDALEKDIRGISSIHKSLSKSFGMQRKTLVRVLALEKQVAELRGEKQQGVGDWGDEFGEWDRSGSRPSSANRTTITGDKEIFGDEGGGSDSGSGSGSGSGSRGRVVTLDGEPRSGHPTSGPSGTRRRIRGRGIRGIRGARGARGARGSSGPSGASGGAIDPGYASRVLGEDGAGSYLSNDERKRRFKSRRISGEDIKRGSSVGGAENIAAEVDANQKAAIDKAKIDIATKYEGGNGITPEGEEGAAGGAESPAIKGLIAPIQAIEGSIDGIIGILESTQDTNKEAAADARKEAEIKKRKGAENKLEKITGPLGNVAEKVLAPVKSIFGKIFGFLTTIIFGNAAMKIWDWFGNPKNAEKITSIFKFLKDWWPVLVAGVMAIFGPIMGPMGFAAGVIALLSWAIPKIIDAIKWVRGLFGGGVQKELDGLDQQSEKTGADLEKSIASDLDKDAKQALKEGPPEQKQTSDQQQIEKTGEQSQTELNQVQEPPTKFASGGQVPGSGSGDTVPAMLTPGEFVMSKGAVQHYGSSTLAGMNAAAGGTNRPTYGYSGGGVVQNVGGSGDMTFKPRFQYSGGGPVINVPRMVSVPKSQPTHRSATYLKFSGGGQVPDQALITEGGANGQDGQDGQAATPGERLLKFIEPLKHIPFVGGKIVEKGGELVGGVQDLIVNAHSGMHSQSGGNQAQLAPSIPDAPPGPPSATGTAAGVVNAVGAAGQQSGQSAGTAPNQSLPSFSAESMRSGSKIKTLGITV